MAAVRLVLAVAAAFSATGCGYIHFGRLPTTATHTGDVALVEALSNLSTEHKILKQELALARKEGDALRVMLDRAATASGSELAARLNETTRELAALRVSHAKLQAERSGRAGAAGALPELEEKLASSLHTTTRLQEENAQLRAELDRARSQNAILTAELKTAVAQKSDAEVALAQLNGDLLAEKEARVRAEQVANAARAQLGAVLAATRPADPAPSPGAEATAAAPSLLQLAKAPPAGASATAELRTSAERLRVAAAGQRAARVHVVEPGETLESLARKYYGREDESSRIRAANASLLNAARTLMPGMQLTIPD